ncbi:MAG: hypothetical protein QOH64_1674 [Acidimicrobiaceae bacterium]
MGGLLVALAAVGVFSAYRGASKQPSTRYVVVARDLAAGTILSPADLSTELVDLPGAVAGRAFTDPGTLVGRITIGPLREGELVQGSVVIDQSRVGTTYQVSLPVERSRALAGGLLAGEKVDLLVTYANETIVVSRGATVIKSDTTSRGAIGPGGETTLILAVATPDEVLAIAHGSQAGKVTVVRATGVAASEPGPASYHPPSASGKGGP